MITLVIQIQTYNIFKPAIYIQQNVTEYGEQGIHFIMLHSATGPYDTLLHFNSCDQLLIEPTGTKVCILTS